MGKVVIMRNIVVDVVNMELDTVMKEVDVCTCARCRMDVTALTLNELKPRYVVTDFGELMQTVSLFESQNRLDIYRALLRACIRVKSTPLHEQSDGIDAGVRTTIAESMEGVQMPPIG